jgi:hypothetical protein
MRMRTILLVAVGLAGGCAVTHATVDYSRVAALPPDALPPLADADHALAAAQVELAFAERARGEASDFLEATKVQLAAARSKRDDDLVDPSAAPPLVAAKAKHDYALRLVALRAAQAREKRALVEQAEADREWQMYRALAAYGRAEGLSAAAFADARVVAHRRVDDAHRKVVSEDAAVNGLRAEWDLRRLGTYTSARATMPSATGANEGPAPSSAPEPTPRAAP